MALNKKAPWGEVWRHITARDAKKLGLVGGEELEEVMREHFPFELD
eukprot:CAMPEP_0202978408 /NCGR_PEP_ID=MMETSP1396-20130829/84842_1 /ASSEMBLY_ACC=CAM_ASM_000872 /TAXON_ID= /ORGANISM="Pseudokeronopsis sp., Strain Brazil" /LENGTH=45 /DNA_ID= /DNA_START= /DNA_END= /DNA_ORIENTATION=